MKRQAALKETLEAFLAKQKKRITEIEKLPDLKKKIDEYKVLMTESENVLNENSSTKDKVQITKLKNKIQAEINTMKNNREKTTAEAVAKAKVKAEAEAAIKPETSADKDILINDVVRKQLGLKKGITLSQFMAELDPHEFERAYMNYIIKNNPEQFVKIKQPTAEEAFVAQKKFEKIQAEWKKVADEYYKQKNVRIMGLIEDVKPEPVPTPSTETNTNQKPSQTIEKDTPETMTEESFDEEWNLFEKDTSEATAEESFEKNKSILLNELKSIFETLDKKFKQDVDAKQKDFVEASKKMLDLLVTLYDKKRINHENTMTLFDLTKELIKKPENHKEFLNAARKYENLAGGEFWARALVFVGSAMNMIKADWGKNYIEQGNEKLAQIKTVRAFATAAAATLPTVESAFSKYFSDLAQSFKKLFEAENTAKKDEKDDVNVPMKGTNSMDETTVVDVLAEIEGLGNTTKQEIKKDPTLSDEIKDKTTSMVSEVEGGLRERILEGTSHRALLGELKHLKDELNHKLKTLAVKHEMDLTDAKETFESDLEKSQSSLQKLTERLTQKGSSQIESIATAIEKYRTDLRNEIAEWQLDRETLLQQIETNESLIKSRRTKDKTLPHLRVVQESLQKALTELDGRIAAHQENMGKLTQQLESKATSTTQKTEAKIKLLTAVKDIIAENRKVEMGKKQDEITSVYQRNERELNKTHLYEGRITLDKAIQQLEQSLSRHTPAPVNIEHRLKDVEEHEALETAEYAKIKADLEKAKGHVALSGCFDTLLTYANKEMELIETNLKKLGGNQPNKYFVIEDDEHQNIFKLDKYTDLKNNLEKALESVAPDVLDRAGRMTERKIYKIIDKIETKLESIPQNIVDKWTKQREQQKADVEKYRKLADEYKQKLQKVTDEKKLDDHTRLDKGMK